MIKYKHLLFLLFKNIGHNMVKIMIKLYYSYSFRTWPKPLVLVSCLVLIIDLFQRTEMADVFQDGKLFCCLIWALLLGTCLSFWFSQSFSSTDSGVMPDIAYIRMSFFLVVFTCIFLYMCLERQKYTHTVFTFWNLLYTFGLQILQNNMCVYV